MSNSTKIEALAKEKYLFTRITDYFEYRNSAIYKYSEKINELDHEDAAVVYRLIRTRIFELFDFYQKKKIDISTLIMPIVNDLYRTMCDATYYGHSQYMYLANTAKLFFMFVKDLGYDVHFATNNVFGNTASITKLFPHFLEDCGFDLIDPYSILESHFSIKAADNQMHQEFLANKSKVLSVVNDLIDIAHKTVTNYFLILPDCQEEDFRLMLDTSKKPGYLNYFKEDEPTSANVLQLPYIAV